MWGGASQFGICCLISDLLCRRDFSRRASRSLRVRRTARAKAGSRDGIGRSAPRTAHPTMRCLVGRRHAVSILSTAHLLPADYVWEGLRPLSFEHRAPPLARSHDPDDEQQAEHMCSSAAAADYLVRASPLHNTHHRTHHHHHRPRSTQPRIADDDGHEPLRPSERCVRRASRRPLRYTATWRLVR